MSEPRKFVGVHRPFTPQEKQRFEEGKRWAEAHKSELTSRALEHKAELQTLIEGVRLLRREREARGLSLAEVAQRAGIDEARLERLESDPHPNLTLAILIRIAEAIGVKLTIGLAAA